MGIHQRKIQMKKIFLDTNIGIDLLTNRSPWVVPASEIMSLANENKILTFCSTLSLATINYYMLREKLARDLIITKLGNFISLCFPISVDVNVAKSALKSPFKDFEDAMQYFSAVSEGCDVIITRNKKDFLESKIPVMEPQEFLDSFYGED